MSADPVDALTPLGEDAYYKLCDHLINEAFPVRLSSTVKSLYKRYAANRKPDKDTFMENLQAGDNIRNYVPSIYDIACNIWNDKRGVGYGFSAFLPSTSNSRPINEKYLSQRGSKTAPENLRIQTPPGSNASSTITDIVPPSYVRNPCNRRLTQPNQTLKATLKETKSSFIPSHRIADFSIRLRLQGAGDNSIFTDIRRTDGITVVRRINGLTIIRYIKCLTVIRPDNGFTIVYIIYGHVFVKQMAGSSDYLSPGSHIDTSHLLLPKGYAGLGEPQITIMVTNIETMHNGNQHEREDRRRLGADGPMQTQEAFAENAPFRSKVRIRKGKSSVHGFIRH
ncbi:hypothetical protein [Absidia glauca]|uniref:Uncharacterized protein n=1 Tax=Absidia glauca TaxID=4829 RepID=A0A163JUQ2_ABSGL|nr:hypothetical protein [Absidia glauca]